ncbi:Cna B domain protein [Oscillatoria nigro-viridis PCC 7112]|uniref:Cna B domain protein n=2 Tax=Phormidium nigroviride TaxID=482564 RepID=K9VK73_9CYAN|nr:SdrD B-like domain-containing protein [Oscillatoria nigro-viridis]AFZ07615.1 Cna B domain protein [Oscillatoria nigro-viridis PCC 7112]
MSESTPTRTASQIDIGNVNIGNFQVGSISGTKYNDFNANGRPDPGEVPIPNWQIYLDLNNNGQPDFNEPSTLTNPQGNYIFANLPPGTYQVREVQQPNFRQTTPNPAPITITSGTNAGNINFGNNFNAGTIAGTKFNDINNNSSRDPGEQGLANWQIYLDLNRNNRLDGGEPFTLTNFQGNYAFVNIPADTYLVREVQQPGFRQTTPDPGPVNVTSNATVNNINFGNVFFVGSISGLKYNDLNANSVRDATDPPLANWPIYIDLNGNGSFDPGEPNTITNPQGNYTFANVSPGRYLVREAQQPGWVQTTPNPAPIDIIGNTNVVGVNFGNNFPTGSISGFKFNDLNANGINEPTEPRVANWPIYLDLNNNGGRDPNEPSTLTNPQGNFSFINLPQGIYVVREVPQPGFRQTTPNPTPITVGNGTNATNLSFGNVLVTGTISGVKFNDFNANGRLDPGEPPIANTQIYIDLNNNSSLDPGEASTFSDVLGNYSFRNVPVGSYVVREVPPPGFILTTPPALVVVSAEIRASKIDLLTGDLLTEDTEGRSAKSLNGDSRTDSSSYAGEPAANNIGADSLPLSSGGDTYRISDFLVDRSVANLGNIPNFGQQNVGLNLNAEISQIVKGNELINSALGHWVSTVAASDFSVM